MALTIAPMDSYRVFQRDTTTGNPPGSTTTYDKGWGEVDLNVTSDSDTPLSYRIVNAQDPTQVIQDWTSTGQNSADGTSTLKLEIPASENGYIVQVAPTDNLTSTAATTPFFMGNVDAAAGQSMVTCMFSSYAYSPTDPVAQPEQYVACSFSTRVYSAVTTDPTSSSPETWLQPGNANTPGGAVQSTFAAEYLNDRQAELGVACALIGNDKPGSSISSWTPGTDNFAYLAATIERAGGKISDFIWDQGDSDNNASAAGSYQQNFQSIINGLNQVVTGSYNVVGFRYAWPQDGSQPNRYETQIYQAQEAVASAHGGNFEEGVSAGANYVGGHPSMESRMLGADDLFRQILALDDPNEDKGPSLTGAAVLQGSTVDLVVAQDKGTALVGQDIIFGGTQVTYQTASSQDLASQFTVFEHGYTDAAHEITVSAVDIVSPTDIRLTLASAPVGSIDVWYRADFTAGVGNPNAVIRDNFTGDGINYGVGLQTLLTPIVVGPGSSSSDGTGGSNQNAGAVAVLTTGSSAGDSTTAPSGSSSSASTTSTTPSNSGLVLDISEDAWQGDAQYTVSVDGQQVGGIYTASASHSAGQTQAVSIPASLAAGDHTVSVTFLNDAYGGSPSADRNLYVDGITLNGAPVANSSAPLTYDSTATFNLVVPDASQTSTSGSSSSSTTTPSGSSSSGSTTTPSGSSSSGSTTTPGGSSSGGSTTTPGGSSSGGSTTTPGGSSSSGSTTTPSGDGSSSNGAATGNTDPSGATVPLTPPNVSSAGLLPTLATIDTTGQQVLTVGVGKEFSTIEAAVAASQNGDVIEVDAGTYTNDFVQTWNKLTIIGVGGMVNMVANELCPNDKAIMTVDNDLTLENFTFTGAKVADGNGAGIRYEAGNMTLTNDAFYNNQNGILGAVTTGIVTINNSVFSGNGSGTGYTHNLYIGQSAELNVTNSVFEDANAGHELKSRALINNLVGNVFSDGPTGTGSYDIDLPDGGQDTIKGNVIEKGPMASNDAMVHFGGEGIPYVNSSLTIEGNLFENDLGASAVALHNETTITANVSNNIFENLSASQLSSGAADLTNNQDGNGNSLENAVASAFPSASSVVFTDSLSHSVVLDGNPLLNVEGGAGLLTVTAQTGRTVVIGGSGGLDFTEEAGSGANQITTSAGSTNTLTLVGEDGVDSQGTDKITTGDESVTGTISGNATVKDGTGYDHWSVTGQASFDVTGGAPFITLASGAQATVTGLASGLTLSSNSGSVAVDVTQDGGDYDGERISFSITSGSTSAFIYDGSVGITTASGTQGASVQLGAGIAQVTSNGTDTISAGSGTDTVIVSGSNTVVHGGSGSLSVFGRGIQAGSDALVYGDGGTITIGGDTGNIIYYGGDQANTVNANLSNITLQGGTGLMTVKDDAYSQTIVGGSGGLDYEATDGNASGTITTATGSTNNINLGSDNPDLRVESWGTDSIVGGSGSVVVHGNATITGGSGTDIVTVTQGANVVYTIGNSGTVSETGATVALSVAGAAPGTAIVTGGSATISGDSQNGISISTTASGGTALTLSSGTAQVTTGGSDDIDANGSRAQITVQSDNVIVVGGSGSVTVNSQSSQNYGLQFTAGSGQATLALNDGGGDNIAFGTGTTAVSITSGQADTFGLFSGTGGGTDILSGFRVGIDQISLHGVSVVSEANSGGSLNVLMSDNTHLELAGITSDRGIFS